jgi:transposase
MEDDMARKKVSTAEETVRNIRRKTRKKYSGEEKIRIVLEGLRGEQSVAELCRREGISESLYYRWSKEFLEAGKERLVGNTKRQASSQELNGDGTNWLDQQGIPSIAVLLSDYITVDWDNNLSGIQTVLDEYGHR